MATKLCLILSLFFMLLGCFTGKDKGQGVQVSAWLRERKEYSRFRTDRYETVYCETWITADSMEFVMWTYYPSPVGTRNDKVFLIK